MVVHGFESSLASLKGTTVMDTLFQEMWHRRGQSAEELWKRHANLE